MDWAAQRRIAYSRLTRKGYKISAWLQGLFVPHQADLGFSSPQNPCNHAELQSAVRLPCGQMWLLSTMGSQEVSTFLKLLQAVASDLANLQWLSGIGSAFPN